MRHRTGLRNLRQRASALGGRLDIESQPGQGTRVTLHWEPLRWEAPTARRV